MICPVCLTDKDLVGNFNIRKANKSGYDALCRSCRKMSRDELMSRPGVKEKVAQSNKQFRTKNRPKVLQWKKNYREKYPEKAKAQVKSCHDKNSQFYKRNAYRFWLKKKYGLDEDAYHHILDIQLDRCSICQTKDLDGVRSQFCVDHCHESGQVRGLLCFNCNTMLGCARDKIATLKRAIEYLEQPNPFGRTYVTPSDESRFDDELMELLLAANPDDFVEEE